METGFKKLDKTIKFDIPKLVVIGSRPAMGKTSLALNIASNVALQNISVLFFSLEMSKEQVINRILASESLVDIKKVSLQRDLMDSDWNKLSNTMKKISDLKLYIDDTPKISINEISNKCKKLKQEKNIELVVIDYLQLIQEDFAITRKLRELAKELNITIIVTSQLAREIDKRENKRPLLADVKNNELIDIIIFVYRDNFYNKVKNQEEKAEIIIAKNNNGDTKEVGMYFVGKYLKFYDKKEQSK